MKAKPVLDLTRNLSRDVQAESIAYFMRFHLDPAHTNTLSQQGFTQTLVSGWASIPAVEDAVFAVAMALFTRIKSLSLESTPALQRYQKSLNALQLSLADIENSNLDESLLNVCFLVRFEDATYSNATPTPQETFKFRESRLHYRGIVAIMEYWAKKQPTARKTSYAITYALRNLRKAALLGAVEMAEWFEDDTALNAFGSEFGLNHVLGRLIRSRTRLATIARKVPDMLSPEDLQSLQILTEETLAIERALLAWLQVFSNSVGFADLYGAQSAPRVQCYGYRILAIHLRMQSLELLQKHTCRCYEDELHSSRCLLDSLAQDLSLAVSKYCLSDTSSDRCSPSDGSSPSGSSSSSDDRSLSSECHDMMPYDAETIVAPLLIAATTPYVDVRYRNWFRTWLRHIGRLTGYGVMEAVATGNWFKL